MNWNTHSNLRGAHAFLGASKYHWLNYDDKKLRESYLNALAVKRGTELHDFAATCIRLKQKLPKSLLTKLSRLPRRSEGVFEGSCIHNSLRINYP